MAIGILISTMIAIIVGVNVIPALLGQVEEAEEASGVTSSLMGVLPIVFVAVILLGAVAAIGSNWEGKKGPSTEKWLGTVVQWYLRYKWQTWVVLGGTALMLFLYGATRI